MSVAAPRYSRGSRLRERFEALEAGPRTRRAAGVAGLVALGAASGAVVGYGGVAGAIALLALVACVFCIRDFRAGVALLIVIMPISQSYLFPHAMFGITGLNPLNLLLAATAVALVMRTAGEGVIGKLAPRSLVWLYVVPLAVGAWLGADDVGRIPAIFRDLDMIFFEEARGYVRDMLLKPLTLVIYALLVAAAVMRSRRPERFVTPLLISIWVMAGVVVVYTAMSGVTLEQLAGTFSRAFFSPLGMHANDLGRLYATAYALLLFIWDRTGHLGHKSALALAMGLVVVALLLTFSRGAFFGFILVNIVYLMSRRRLKTLLIAALLVPVALYFVPGEVWSRMSMGFGAGLNEISAGRVGDIWAPLLPELPKSPVWGNGLGSILWSTPMIEGRLMQVAHPHNAYLQALLDLGAVGLVLLLAFWIHMWRRFRAFGRDARLTPELQGFFEGAAAGLLSFLIAGVAGSSLMPVPAQAFLWLAVGMMYGMRARLAAPAAKAAT